EEQYGIERLQSLSHTCVFDSRRCARNHARGLFVELVLGSGRWRIVRKFRRKLRSGKLRERSVSRSVDGAPPGGTLGDQRARCRRYIHLLLARGGRNLQDAEGGRRAAEAHGQGTILFALVTHARYQQRQTLLPA